MGKKQVGCKQDIVKCKKVSVRHIHDIQIFLIFFAKRRQPYVLTSKLRKMKFRFPLMLQQVTFAINQWNCFK